MDWRQTGGGQYHTPEELVGHLSFPQVILLDCRLKELRTPELLLLDDEGFSLASSPKDPWPYTLRHVSILRGTSVMALYEFSRAAVTKYYK